MTKITSNRKNDIDLFKSCKFVLHATDDELISSSKLTNKVLTKATDNVEPFVDKTAKIIGDFGNALIDGVKALSAHLKEAAVKAEFDILCLELQGRFLTSINNRLGNVATSITNDKEMIKYLAKEEGDYEADIAELQLHILKLNRAAKYGQFIRGQVIDSLEAQKDIIWENKDKSVEELKEILKDSTAKINALYAEFDKILNKAYAINKA